MKVRAVTIVVAMLVLTAGCLGGISDLDGDASEDVDDGAEEADSSTDEGSDDADGGDSDAGDSDADDSDSDVTDADADGSNGEDTDGGDADESDGDEGDDRDASTSMSPGVTDAGVEDLDSLLDANAETLAEEGYEVTIEQTSESSFGSTESVQTIRADGDGRMSVTVSSAVEDDDFESAVWVDGDRVYTRDELQGETQYSVVDSPAQREAFGPSPTIEGALDLFEFDASVTDDGLIQLEATDVAEEYRDDEFVDLSDFSVTVLMDRDGQIREITQSYDDGTSEVSMTYTLESTGDVDLEEPAWVDDARAEATMLDLTTEREGDAIAITNEGDEPIEAGTSILVSESDPANAEDATGGTAELETAIEPGETAYVSLTGGYEAAISIGSPADVDADELPAGQLQVMLFGENELLEVETIEEA